MWLMRVIGLLAVIVSACGDGSSIGDRCETDRDCATSVCWDFAEHDALCAGKVCSATCATDDDCVQRARNVGASSPDRAQCGDDHECDLVGTGLGSFVCS